jgi:ADP-heptose:LPS heptosyltransferase
MIDQPPGSPLCGRYLVRNRVANRILRISDWILANCRCLGQWPPAIPKPKRILLCNGAHFGDVFLSLSLLPALRSAFPHARIGFLSGMWARHLLDHHALVDWLHHVDHWKLNRSNRPFLEKLAHHRRTRRQALREIRRIRYDVAIDLYYYFPNSIPLLWQAGIPCRIGYTSGGFGPLLTHRMDWVLADRHVTDYQADLLRVVGVTDRDLWKPHAPLVQEGEPLPRDVVDDLHSIDVPPRGFVVFHMGTAASMKEWPPEHWRRLAQLIAADGHALVFTGTQGREWRNCEGIRASIGGAINLCGRLSWNDLVTVIRRARLLVGVDSVAGHVAAAVGTPSIVISSGITHSAHWRPRSAVCRVIRHPVPCAPCYLSHGCEGMECVRLVAVEKVHQAALDLLWASEQLRA